MADTIVKVKTVTLDAAEMLRVMHRIKQRGGDRKQRIAALTLFLVSFAQAEQLTKEELLTTLKENIDVNWEVLSDDFRFFLARKRGAS